ncbi:MAG: hypothetical protein AAGP08_19075 [Pseudomonadota bacterium]
MVRQDNLTLSTLMTNAVHDYGVWRVVVAAMAARRAALPRQLDIPDLPACLRRDVGLTEERFERPFPEHLW